MLIKDILAISTKLNLELAYGLRTIKIQNILRDINLKVSVKLEKLTKI